MSNDLKFKAIFKSVPRNVKDLESFIKKVWKSTLNKSTYVVEGYLEGEIYHAPLLIDLRKEWKSLSSSDMKLLLQKELYGSKWHHVEAANISESLKLFKQVETNQKIIMNTLILKIIKLLELQKILTTHLRIEESIRDWHEMRSSWFSRNQKLKKWM